MILLTAIDGPTTGMTWMLGESPLVVGRVGSCDIVVPDASVSRRHCELTCVGDRLHVRDLGSSNLTLVNGESTHECLADAGDRIGVGPALFLVSMGNPEASRRTGSADASTTASLSEADVAYLRGSPEAIAELDNPQTVRDLAALFRVGRRLNRSKTPRALAQVVGESLRDRFGDCDVWLARFRGSDQETYFYATNEDERGPSEDKPTALMRQAVEQEQALEIAENRGRILVSPMLTGGATVGALAVRVPEDCPCAGAGGLAFLLALGSQAAPLVVSLEHAELMQSDLDRLRAVSGKSTRLVGISKAIQAVRRAILETAESGLSVLILGATGTGKELAARMVHDVSTRPTGPFVVVNCAAIPHNLLESELFGYDKGAFTGADAAKKGRFEQADGGTLFLDEIGDLGPECQARLLRAIESGTFYRLGGVHETHVNVRVVSATNKDIRKAVQEGTFRQDLYHRLNGFEIGMPSLRDRPSDIPILAEHFLELGRVHAKRPIARLSDEAVEFLKKNRWPGNVRELRAAIERGMARASSDVIEAADLRGPAPAPGGELGIGTPVPLAEIEKRHIAAVLRECNGNMSAAARVLAINRGTLYKKVRDYGIEA